MNIALEIMWMISTRINKEDTMRFIIFLFLSLISSLSCYSSVRDNNGLQVVIYDDYRAAPVAVPIYFSFELKNISQQTIVLPFEEDKDFHIIVRDVSGNTLHQGGPTSTSVGWPVPLTLKPSDSYFYSKHLNNIFAYQIMKEGTYFAKLVIEAHGYYDTGEFVNNEMLSVRKSCWKGRIETPEIEISITAPPTEEDAAIFAILTKQMPIPNHKSWLPNRETIFNNYPDTIYAGLANMDGYFLKNPKYSNQYDHLKVIAAKYPNSPISLIINYNYAGFSDPNDNEKKIRYYEQFIEQHKGTAWAEKAKRRIAWLKECLKNKDSDACKYPKNPM